MDSQDYVLEHENAANLQVENAKKEKEFILKKAQEEASSELKEYTVEKETKYNNDVTKLTSNSDELDEIKAKSIKEIEHINSLYDKNNEAVINLLFEHVITVKYEVPDVVKGCFEEIFGMINE